MPRHALRGAFHGSNGCKCWLFQEAFGSFFPLALSRTHMESSGLHEALCDPKWDCWWWQVDMLSNGELQESALAAILAFAANPPAARLLVSKGAVPELAGCLTSAKRAVKLEAAKALVVLSDADEATSLQVRD
eukprot:scaffold23362_cov26-Prasinocladus_malaysianus.AAC.1